MSSKINKTVRHIMTHHCVIWTLQLRKVTSAYKGHGKKEEKLNQDFVVLRPIQIPPISVLRDSPLYFTAAPRKDGGIVEPIKLATSHLLKCKVLYTTSGNRLIIFFSLYPCCFSPSFFTVLKSTLSPLMELSPLICIPTCFLSLYLYYEE